MVAPQVTNLEPHEFIRGSSQYLIALVAHGFSWTFMVMLPIAIAYQLSPPRFFYLFFAMNLVIHVLIDHMKANLRKISLTTDQTLHIAQILATFFALM